MLIIKQYWICNYDLLKTLILCLLCVGDTIRKMNAEKRERLGRLGREMIIRGHPKVTGKQIRAYSSPHRRISQLGFTWILIHSTTVFAQQQGDGERNAKPDLSQLDLFPLLFNAFSLLTLLYLLFPPQSKFTLPFPNWSSELKEIKRIISYNIKRQNTQRKHLFDPRIFRKGYKAYANQGILTSTFI